MAGRAIEENRKHEDSLRAHVMGRACFPGLCISHVYVQGNTNWKSFLDGSQSNQMSEKQ